MKIKVVFSFRVIRMYCYMLVVPVDYYKAADTRSTMQYNTTGK